MTTFPPLAAAGAAVAAVASLSACGGGGAAANASGNTTAGTATTSEPLGVITPARAARFLQQAAFGATDAQIARVQTLGYAAWLDEQFRAPRTASHVEWMLAKGYQDVANIDNFNGVDNTLWRKLISSPDVLRQRVTLALSEIFVISMLGLPVAWRGFLAAAYMDTLETQAFGTYRQLLEAVT